jgi:nucleoside-diphosphate-sugar epimerase
MNILLTGHKGFIGTALYKTLAVNNNVHGIDLLKGDNLLDCEWPVDIDLVIHLAGKSGVRESINDPAAYWTNNIIASRRLFERYQNI